MKFALLSLAILAITANAQDDFDDFENDEVDAAVDGFCTGDECDKVNGFEEEDISEVEDVEETFEVDNEEIDNRVDVGNEMMDVVANEFDDDDEFINEPVDRDPVPKAKQSKEASSGEDLKFFNKEDVPTLKKPVYYIEYGLGFILFLYVLNYIYGRLTNGNLAADWFEKAQPFLETQFALIGDAGEKELVSSMTVTREADHIFTLWCSGRSNISGMLATLKLIKRQDVFTQVHASYIVPSKDQMILKFTLDRIDPICLAIGRSSALKDILENYTDISYYCADKIKSGERYGLGRLSTVTESSDALSIFDKKIQKILQGPVGDALVSLHISDSFQGARVPEGEEQEAPSQAVIFVFDMIDTEKCALQFLKFAIFFVDMVSRYSLSKEALERHRRRRKKRDDDYNRLRHQERQEELARKKEDERRDAYQRMVDEADPEKQKRMEYELNKKDLKRNQRKTLKMKQMKIRT